MHNYFRKAESDKRGGINQILFSRLRSGRNLTTPTFGFSHNFCQPRVIEYYTGSTYGKYDHNYHVTLYGLLI